MTNLFVVKVEYLNDMTGKIVTDWSLLNAEDYAAATAEVLEGWGEDHVVGMYLFQLDEGPISISASMADAFMNDLPEDVYVCQSEWRRNHESKKYQEEN